MVTCATWLMLARAWVSEKQEKEKMVTPTMEEEELEEMCVCGGIGEKGAMVGCLRHQLCYTSPLNPYVEMLCRS